MSFVQICSRSKLALFMLVGIAVGACQPTPEERLARAESYLAAADYRSAVIELKNVLQAQPDLVQARLLLAEASYALADFASAENQYQRVLAFGEANIEIWIAYGRTLLAQGKADEALGQVAPNIEAFEDVEPAVVLLGDIDAVLGNLDGAEQYYRRALTLDPGSLRGLIGSAIVASANGEMATAEQFLDAAIAESPESLIVWRAKADLLRTQQKFAEAAEHYAKAINAEKPTTPFADGFEVRQNQIASLIESGQFDDAARRLNQLHRMLPNHPLVTIFRGQIAFGQGDYELAETEMLRYLVIDPDDARCHAILGAINFAKNNLGQAEQYLSYAVRVNAGGETTRLLLAETQLRLDRPDAALGNLQAAQFGGESDAVLLAMLGRAKQGQGDTELAIDYFEQSVALEGGSNSVNLALASSYIGARRYADAVTVLTQMPTGSNGDYRRDAYLMNVYIEQGDVAQAELLGDQLIRMNDGDAHAYALVAVLHQNLGHKARSLDYFEKALAIDPDNAGALYGFGVAALSDGDLGQGIERLDRLLDAHPANVPALIQLASAFGRSGNLTAINARLDSARKVAPDSIPVRKLSVRLKLMQRQTSAAMIDIEADRKDFPTDPGFLHLEGLAHLQSDNIRAALTSLSQATKAQPDNPTYQFDLASALLANRDFGQAIAAARTYRMLRPADIRGLELEINGEIRTGNANRAREALADYAERYPSEDLVMMLYGDIELSSGNAAEAVTWYEKYSQTSWNRNVVLRLAAAHQTAGTGRGVKPVERWLRENPDDVQMRLFYGQILEAEGQTDRAIEEYERLDRRGEINAVGLNNLAWQYSQQGRSGGIALAERASELAPDNGQVTDTLGWILFQEGQLSRAEQVLRRAASQAPGNAEIQYHLARALTVTGKTAEATIILTELLKSGVQFPSRSEALQLAESL